ncbi:MAG: alkaline phosphatase family protein [Vicinamibacterales bacterium]
MPTRRPIAVLLVALLLTYLPGRAQAPADAVIVITIDGLRWQEFFGGADRDYFERDRDGNAGEPERRFWRESAPERRAALMPFVWSRMATEGQIFGAPEAQSLSHLTNGLWFSYPGYNELLAGVADPRIDSNAKVPNPNVTVLEWLNRRPGFEDRVAAFGSWDVLPFILNTDRSGLPVGTGWQPVPTPRTDREREINTLAGDLPRYWDYGPFDAPMVAAALDRLQTRPTRVLYLMLGEGDEWAHEGRYDMYLDATRRADRFIERLWTAAQALPALAGRTALLVTTDHGRGATPKDWSDHGRDVPAAERTWIALLGPGIPGLGLRRGVTVTTSQVAATIASLLGEDFRAAVPAAAPPLAVR